METSTTSFSRFVRETCDALRASQVPSHAVSVLRRQQKTLLPALSVIERANRLYITMIHDQIEGDAFFPVFKPAEFTVTEQKKFDDPLPHTFMILTRKRQRISKSRIKPAR